MFHKKREDKKFYIALENEDRLTKITYEWIPVKGGKNGLEQHKNMEFQK